MNSLVRLDPDHKFIPHGASTVNITRNILVLDSHLGRHGHNDEHTNILTCLTSTFLSFKAFPLFIRKGTPSHLSLFILKTAAEKVGQVEPGGTWTQEAYDEHHIPLSTNAYCCIIQVSHLCIWVFTWRVCLILSKNAGRKRQGGDCLQHLHLLISVRG